MPTAAAANPDSPLAVAIRSARWRLVLSQREAARQLGLSTPYLCQIERGRRVPSLDALRRIAALLRLDPNHLAGLALRASDPGPGPG